MSQEYRYGWNKRYVHSSRRVSLYLVKLPEATTLLVRLKISFLENRKEIPLFSGWSLNIFKESVYSDCRLKRWVYCGTCVLVKWWGPSRRSGQDSLVCEASLSRTATNRAVLCTRPCTYKSIHACVCVGEQRVTWNLEWPARNPPFRSYSAHAIWHCRPPATHVRIYTQLCWRDITQYNNPSSVYI